ncbi:unnamed protein product, partial [Effrenium voratum]
YAIYPHFYSNARLYTDVQPSLPSGSVGDAGKLIFTPSSFVDINQSAAYVTERGSIFCAAPVRDLHDIRQMQYWAVGVSCCSQGDFWCDDAKDSKAQGGIVIFDNEGFFSGSSFDEYQKAAKKAEATHHLLSVHHPMYIRWAHKDNLDKVANEYNMKAGLTLTAFSLAYAAVSAAMAVALAKPHGPHVMGRCVDSLAPAKQSSI